MQQPTSFLFFLFFISLFACQTTPKGEIADIIYHNGTVITMEGEAQKATSVAIKAGKILAVSEQALMAAHQGDSTKVIDLAGKTMLPGFVDAHSHIAMGMSLLAQANLSSPPVSDVTSISGMVQKLKTHQEKNNISKGDWVIGWGYDPDLLSDKRHPTKLDLDEAFPDNPVFLLHVSGHMGVVNSVALAKVGIDETTKNPAGGMIVRLPNSNEPSGLVQETAVYEVRKALPLPTPAQMMVLIEEVQNLYASHGITTVSYTHLTLPTIYSV